MRIKKAIQYIIVKKLFNNCSETTQNSIRKDAVHKSGKDFSYSLLQRRLDDFPQFRNVFKWRIEHDCEDYSFKKALIKLLGRVYPEQSTVEIYVRSGEIGENFWLPHRYCVINAEKIGKNVSVLQGVTIGDNHEGARPVIGDNVVIYPNAVVVGGITIGNNVYIGAGSFVNYDVPDGGTVRASKSEYTIYQRKSEGTD